MVVEGLDGSGKRTLTAALTAALQGRGARVASLAFPRYGDSVEADLVADALQGRAGDLGASVHGMAALFALDRAGAVEELTVLLAGHDVVLADRYTASNAAFGAARLHEDADGEFVEWVRGLEFDRLGLPVPALQLLLRVPVELAASRARQRAAADHTRARDAFERDAGLQERTAVVYEELAARAWGSPWQVVDGGPDGPGAAQSVLDRLVG